MGKIILLVLSVWAASAEEVKLPIRRVALYKNGVGYFEHLGQVENNREIGIWFTPGQLNDVLKSLTVLDPGGGKVSGVTYGSKSPLDRQLGDLHLPLGEKTALSEFLAALRGARLEIKTASGTASGRLLSVERKTRMGGGTTLEVDYLSLVGDSGEVKTIELTSGYGVKLLDRELAGKVDRYLSLLSSTRDADLRRMTVSTTGKGARQLFVSYISEVPVWKTTYRLVLPSKAQTKPFIQGWAIVDNTVGEDWENVQLSLIAGAPQSFIQNLAQPFFARRPEVAMSAGYNASPQTYEATLRMGSAKLAGVVGDPSGVGIGGARVRVLDGAGTLIAETQTNPAGRYEFPALPNGTMRVEIQNPGFRSKVVENVQLSAANPRQMDTRLDVGDVSESVTVSSSPALLSTESSSVTGGLNLGSGRSLGGGGVAGLQRAPIAGASAVGIGTAMNELSAAADAQGLGDLFEYKLREPVTIRKNQSAMVPIVQSPLEMEKVSVWSPSTARPYRALWIHNTADVTLDGGSFSVLEEDTFAGEGIMEAIRPKEKRLVSFAVDLALQSKMERQSAPQRLAKVSIQRGMIVQSSQAVESTLYTFRNEDSAPRAVIVEHPNRPGYALSGTTEPVESTATVSRFRLNVASKQTATLRVTETKTLSTSVAVSNLSADQIRVFLTNQLITPAVEQALARIQAQQRKVSELDDQAEGLDEEKERIFNDQQRLRENMKSLKGTAEEKVLVQRYTQQLSKQEDRLEQIGKDVSSLKERKDSASGELDRMIAELSFNGSRE